MPVLNCQTGTLGCNHDSGHNVLVPAWSALALGGTLLYSPPHIYIYTHIQQLLNNLQKPLSQCASAAAQTAEQCCTKICVHAVQLIPLHLHVSAICPCDPHVGFRSSAAQRTSVSDDLTLQKIIVSWVVPLLHQRLVLVILHPPKDGTFMHVV